MCEALIMQTVELTALLEHFTRLAYKWMGCTYQLTLELSDTRSDNIYPTVYNLFKAQKRQLLVFQ